MKKNLILTLSMLFATVLLANGQFEKAMGKNIPAMFQAKTPEAMQAVINQLTRIGEAEGDRWEPYYYTAFGYLRMSMMFESAADKDKYLDLSMEAVEKGLTIKPNDSELEAMKGYVNMIKVSVDPATRGMQYSGMAMASFQKAIALDDSNPRAHFLLGRMQYGTAQFMGSSTDEACGSMNRALELFEKEGTAENSLAPTWGRGATVETLNQLCGAGESGE